MGNQMISVLKNGNNFCVKKKAPEAVKFVSVFLYWLTHRRLRARLKTSLRYTDIYLNTKELKKSSPS